MIDSITVLRSPAWEIHPVLSQNVTISNITINSYGPNNDGCDPECCTDVLIKNCYFNTGDDCIAIKSGKNDDGRRVNVPCQNIIIKGCHMIDGHGGVTLGSEMTGGIRNVYADSCSMTGSNLNMMLRFKTNTARGGVIENIYARNINELMDTQGSIYIDMFYGGETGNYNPTIRNIFVQNVISSQSKYAIYISDDKNFPLTNLQLTDCTFNNSASGYVLGNSKQVVFKNVKINGITYTAVKNEETLNTKFQLYQNYPNPFNPETNIKYEIKTPGYVTLKVYDLLGREVSTLVNEFKPAGLYNTPFSILPTGRQVLNSKICSGLYFYKLTSGEFTAIHKMIILK